MAEGWFHSFHMDFQKSNPATEDIGKEDFLLPCDARAGKKNEPYFSRDGVSRDAGGGMEQAKKRGSVAKKEHGE